MKCRIDPIVMFLAIALSWAAINYNNSIEEKGAEPVNTSEQVVMAQAG